MFTKFKQKIPDKLATYGLCYSFRRKVYSENFEYCSGVTLKNVAILCYIILLKL